MTPIDRINTIEQALVRDSRGVESLSLMDRTCGLILETVLTTPQHEQKPWQRDLCVTMRVLLVMEASPADNILHSHTLLEISAPLYWNYPKPLRGSTGGEQRCFVANRLFCQKQTVIPCTFHYTRVRTMTFNVYRNVFVRIYSSDGRIYYEGPLQMILLCLLHITSRSSTTQNLYKTHHLLRRQDERIIQTDVC